MKIEHLARDPSQTDDIGYTEPGWYIWEEEDNVIGPYTTEQKAISAMDYYVKNLA